MKNDNLKTVLMLLTLLMFVASQVFAETKLTEKSVYEFAESLQKTVNKQDVDGFMSHFSADAKIQMNMPENLGGTINTTLKDYKAMLVLSWGMPAEFTYEIKDTSTSIGQDGKSATLKETVLETMAMDGEMMTSTSSVQTSKIVLVSGKPKIISLEMDITMEGM